MYKLVKEILEVSKRENVDIGVAYDKIAHTDNYGYTDELKVAHSFLQDNYKVITTLRNQGEEAEIEKICGIFAEQGQDAVEEYIANFIEK